MTRIGSLSTLVLKTQATNKYLEARLSTCMDCLGKVVQDGVEILKSQCLSLILYTHYARELTFQNFCVVFCQMPLLSGKLVSLAINAVAHTRRHTQLLAAAGKRVIEIAKRHDEGLDVQAVSVIVNGFARAGLRDVALFRHMSAVALRLIETKRSDFGAQAISVIANAFVKVHITDEMLFTRLAYACEHVAFSDFTPQAIANIMNAYARHDNLDNKALFAFLSKVSRQSVPSQWESRHLALVVNALAKVDYKDDGLLKWIAEAALARPTSSFDVQGKYSRKYSIYVPLA